jgi:hypothetical protein
VIYRRAVRALFVSLVLLCSVPAFSQIVEIGKNAGDECAVTGTYPMNKVRENAQWFKENIRVAASIGKQFIRVELVADQQKIYLGLKDGSEVSLSQPLCPEARAYSPVAFSSKLDDYLLIEYSHEAYRVIAVSRTDGKLREVTARQMGAPYVSASPFDALVFVSDSAFSYGRIGIYRKVGQRYQADDYFETNERWENRSVKWNNETSLSLRYRREEWNGKWGSWKTLELCYKPHKVDGSQRIWGAFHCFDSNFQRAPKS